MFFPCWQVLMSLPEVTQDKRACPCSQVTLGPRGTLGETFEVGFLVCEVIEVEGQRPWCLSADESGIAIREAEQWRQPRFVPEFASGAESGQGPREEGVTWLSRRGSAVPLWVLRLKTPEEETRRWAMAWPVGRPHHRGG